MRAIFSGLKTEVSVACPAASFPRRLNNARELQVVPPQRVDLAHPNAVRDEICVPASINGRDLSGGTV